MNKPRLGKLEPRYSFMINPYSDIRLSRRPKCERLTHPRKFALVIAVKKQSIVVLGKTCRYCSRCELIAAHRDELEAELANSPHGLAPSSPGEGYMVMGTVALRTWRKVMKGEGMSHDDLPAHMADIKTYLELHVDPGGWRPME